MPKAKRKPADGGNRREDVREHLVCGESDEDWEAALIMARSMVRDAIWDLCKDPTRRDLSHMQIIARVEEYVRSLIRTEERKSGERIVFRREFLEQPLAGVAALKRLGRPQASYAIAKAWKEMPQ